MSEQPSRRQQILETLAMELEKSPGVPITTAGLARAVGVSEAALYRHFASKAKMFEALIEFIEDSVFGLVNRILEDENIA
jgi:TetR/AcrR family transcriptional regulator